MSRGRKRIKKNINPLVENIADFSDIEYDDDDGAELIAKHESDKRDSEKEDETDRMWMYKTPDSEKDEGFYSEEVTDEDLWNDVDKKEKEVQKVKVTEEPSNPVVRAGSDIDKYMTAAVWFNEISERGEMTKEETRYVELMLIEMTQFYFDRLDKIKPSGKCLDAIRKIGKSRISKLYGTVIKPVPVNQLHPRQFLHRFRFFPFCMSPVSHMLP